MRPLVKKLISTKCELLISPIRELDPENGMVYLEFVTGPDIDVYDVAVVSEAPVVYKLHLNDDGLYTYYRLKIWTTELLMDEEFRKEKLYYDIENQKLMLGLVEVTDSKTLIDVADTQSTALGIQEFVEEPVFSICRLDHCLSELQRKFIFGTTSDRLIESCDDTAEDEFARNFLFSTVFVLRQLIKQQRFIEADRILKSVNRCEGFCDKTSASKRNCGCR